MITYRVNVSQPVDRFEVIADQAAHPERILRRWAGYLRSQAKKRFEAGGGWPGWAESTRRKYEQTRTAAVTVHGQVRKSYGAHLTSYLRKQLKQGVVTAGGDLAELRRLIERGNPAQDTGQHSKAIDRLRKNLRKAQAGKRAGGDKRKSARAKLLGKLASSILTKTEGVTVKGMSRVPWSGVHNEGGSAGHGARIPERVFLTIDAQNRVVLAKIALEQLQERR